MFGYIGMRYSISLRRSAGNGAGKNFYTLLQVIEICRIKDYNDINRILRYERSDGDVLHDVRVY